MNFTSRSVLAICFVHFVAATTPIDSGSGSSVVDTISNLVLGLSLEETDQVLDALVEHRKTFIQAASHKNLKVVTAEDKATRAWYVATVVLGAAVVGLLIAFTVCIISMGSARSMPASPHAQRPSSGRYLDDKPQLMAAGRGPPIMQRYKGLSSSFLRLYCRKLAAQIV
jgi:hypothetical protein